jgi:hypothetical protein
MRTYLAQSAAALVMTATALSSASSADSTDVKSSAADSTGVYVTLDRAAYTKVPNGTVTIVVGNPLIADVRLLCQEHAACSEEARRVVVVTGRGYGITNLLAFGQDGGRLVEKSVRVGSPSGTVVIFRGSGDKGILRESYSCAPYCERRVTLGDAPEFFNEMNAETRARQPEAAGVGAAGGAASPR